MKAQLQFILFMLSVAFLLPSCKSEESLVITPINLSGASTILGNENRIDQYINENFTSPYNIEIQYKWEDINFDQSRNLVPADTAVIIPILFALKTVWLDNYVKLMGVNPMKKLVPKLIVISGGKNFNPGSSTITQGTADAGKQITLFQANEYTPGNPILINRYFHILQHEFAHILHQNILYNIDAYTKITPTYTADWYNFGSDKSRQSDGFITSYARAARDEDFAEMVSTMLTNSRTFYNDTLLTLKTITGYPTITQSSYDKIKSKEAIIVKYFKDKYRVDFYALQDSMNKYQRLILK